MIIGTTIEFTLPTKLREKPVYTGWILDKVRTDSEYEQYNVDNYVVKDMGDGKCHIINPSLIIKFL